MWALRGERMQLSLFRRGQMVRKLPIDEVVDLLVQEVENLDKETAGREALSRRRCPPFL